MILGSSNTTSAHTWPGWMLPAPLLMWSHALGNSSERMALIQDEKDPATFPSPLGMMESDLENQMQRSVPKYRSLVWGRVEPISLRNWSGNLIKRDKSCHSLSRLKILGGNRLSLMPRTVYLMSESQPTSGKAKFNAGNKDNYFLKIGSSDSFWFLWLATDLSVADPHYCEGCKAEEPMAKRNEVQIVDLSLLHSSADDCPALPHHTHACAHARTQTHIPLLS